MDPLILVALVAGVPLALALVFRASSVYLFTSIAAGALLVEYLSDDVALVVNTFMKGTDPLQAVHLALLLTPVVLTLLLLRGTLKGSKFVLELLPLLASVAMLVVLLVPQLPGGIQADILKSPYGRTIHQSQDVVIGAAVVLNLGLMWLIRRKHSDDKGHSSKKHH